MYLLLIAKGSHESIRNIPTPEDVSRDEVAMDTIIQVEPADENEGTQEQTGTDPSNAPPPPTSNGDVVITMANDLKPPNGTVPKEGMGSRAPSEAGDKPPVTGPVSITSI